MTEFKLATTPATSFLQGGELVPEVEEADAGTGLGRLADSVKGLKDGGTECQRSCENRDFGFHGFLLALGFWFYLV